MELPKYVWFGKVGNCAMRIWGNNYYYRDGGEWGTDAKIIDGKIISCGHSGSFAYLNNNQLIPCTKYEWWNSNGRYAPKIHVARVKGLTK